MITTKQLVVLTTTTLLAFAAGAAVGVLYTKEKLGKEFDERLEYEVEIELAAAKRKWNKLHKRGEFDMPQIVETSDMMPVEREAAQAMQRYQGNNTLLDHPREEPEKYEHAAPLNLENNVFENRPEMVLEEYENLIKNRDRDSPYVVTLAEFMTNEDENEQDSLVYFQGDGILVDARDDVVEDPNAVVGDDNLVKFGHFSGDPKAVYVRNETLKHDFEIISHEGSYAYVVHGIEPTVENVEV